MKYAYAAMLFYRTQNKITANYKINNQGKKKNYVRKMGTEEKISKYGVIIEERL